MTRQSLLRTGAGLAFAGLATLAASPAFATTPSSLAPSTHAGATSSAVLAKIQAAGAAAINQRLTALNQVVTVLNGTSWLGPDQATLVTTAQNDIAGLTKLEGQLAADTTVQQAKTDFQQIFAGFRVFALVIPVDHMVRASDGITNVVVPKFNALETKWAALNDPQIAGLLADMQSKTQAADTAVNGLPTTLEVLTPPSWNSDHGVLSQPRSELGSARQDLKQARDDAGQIVQILRSQHPHGGSAVNPSTSSSTSSSTTSSSSTSSTVAS
jgi:stage V sporulation protein SpoVS